jgi:hypothetical protein
LQVDGLHYRKISSIREKEAERTLGLDQAETGTGLSIRDAAGGPAPLHSPSWKVTSPFTSNRAIALGALHAPPLTAGRIIDDLGVPSIPRIALVRAYPPFAILLLQFWLRKS